MPAGAEVSEQREAACSQALNYASTPLPVQIMIEEPQEACISLAILVSFLAPFSEPLQSQHVGQGSRLDSQTGPSTCAVSIFSRLLHLLGLQALPSH